MVRYRFINPIKLLLCIAWDTHIPLGEFTGLSGTAYNVIRNQLFGYNILISVFIITAA